MRLLVIGSTGRVGSEVVRRALDAGHHVTAFARDPGAVAGRGERLRVAQGDVLDEASIEQALAGQDAVVSCLGTKDRKQRGLRTEGTRRVLAAMRSATARRLVVFSAFGVGDSEALLRRTDFFFSRVILPLFLARQFEDMAGMEALVRRSPLEWVIVRPGALTGKPATGAVKVAGDGNGKPGSSIPIADVAAFMLECATSASHVRSAPVIYA
jgi:putative NADH-flavin reductase